MLQTQILCLQLKNNYDSEKSKVLSTLKHGTKLVDKSLNHKLTPDVDSINIFQMFTISDDNKLLSSYHFCPFTNNINLLLCILLTIYSDLLICILIISVLLNV